MEVGNQELCFASVFFLTKRSALLMLPNCSSQHFAMTLLQRFPKLVQSCFHRHRPSEPAGTFTSPNQEQGLLDVETGKLEGLW